MIFCAKEKFWQELCEILEVPELAKDDRCKDFSARYQNQEFVVAEVQSILLNKTTLEWLKLLRGKVPCAPVNNLSQALADPFSQERGLILETEHPIFGSVKQAAGPFKVSDSEISHRCGPALGEHTVLILREYLGYDTRRIEDLTRKRIL